MENFHDMSAYETPALGFHVESKGLEDSIDQDFEILVVEPKKKRQKKEKEVKLDEEDSKQNWLDTRWRR